MRLGSLRGRGEHAVLVKKPENPKGSEELRSREATLRRFYRPERFPFCDVLESHFDVIRAEEERVDRACYRPWIERELYTEGGWRVTTLFLDGPSEMLEPQCEHNVELCPRTAQLLRSIPGLVGAAFSMLMPGTSIYSHRGLERRVLRCHLGLDVPDGCALRFRDEERTWIEGKCLVFEDTLVHDAWNRGERPRIALLADFAKAVYDPGGP